MKKRYLLLGLLFLIQILSIKAVNIDSLQKVKKGLDHIQSSLARIELAKHYIQVDTVKALIELSGIVISELDLNQIDSKEIVAGKLNLLKTLDKQALYRLKAKQVLNNQATYQDTLFRYTIQNDLVEEYLHAYQYDSALIYVTSLMTFLENSTFRAELGKVIYRKSVIHYSLGDYEDALELIFRAIEQSQYSNNEAQLGKAYLQLGNVYYFLKSFTDAEEFYHKAKEYFGKVGDFYGVANCNSNLGLLAANRGEYARGVGYQIIALGEIEKSGNEIAIGNTYHYLAEGYLGLLNYDSASYYVEKSIISNQKTSYLTGLCFDFLIKAEIELAANKLAHVSQLLKQAINYWTQQPDSEAERKIRLFESKFYKKQGKFKEAHRALERYTIIVDSLNIDDNRMKMLALQEKGKLSRAQYDLRLAQEKSKLKEIENANQEKQILIVTSIAIITMMLFIVSLIIIRKNKRLNIELALQKNEINKQLNVKESLLSEIHHRVKNNLQIISSMLSLQAQYIDDQRLENIVSVCRSRITSMSLIHESLYKRKEDNSPLFSDYVKKLIPTLIETYQVDENKIKLVMDIHSIELSHDDSLPCGLIINEVVSNALKHAFPNGKDGEIIIEMKKEGDLLVLKISDNGKGLPFEIKPKEQDSFGFLLIYTLADQLEADVNLDVTKGLSFQFSWKDKSNVVY